METRGTGLYLGWNCWPLPPFCPASALKRKSSQAQGDIWPHPTELLNSSLPSPDPEQPPRWPPSSTLDAFPQPPFLTGPPLPTPLLGAS